MKFNWFKNWGNKEPQLKQRSSRNYESITQDEGKFIAYRISKNLPPCPDCKKGFFIKGPEGCWSQNVLCNNCHSEFNIFFINSEEAIGERISNVSICDKSRSLTIYGVK